MTLKYNIVQNDGEQSSVTVFIPGKDPLVATREHPKFDQIVREVSQQRPDLTDTFVSGLEGLFDESRKLAEHFNRLSDRISVGAGRVYFDMMPVDNAITAEILRYVSAGLDDYKPLVNFMEKIETNPLEHSRQNLFRWLEKHDFAIAPDGDFYAYKGLGTGWLSSNSGRAIVNGEVHQGRIPNRPGSVIEMPRNEVQHDPRHGCSTGLHVANWMFAKDFARGGGVVKVKVNPRDVVSVPTESNDDKMRVCRYVVIEVATSEDKSLLLRSAERTARVVGQVDPNGKKLSEHGQAPAKARVPGKKKAPAKKAKPVAKLPEYYEQFNRTHFNALPLAEVKWLAGEWGIVGR